MPRFNFYWNQNSLLFYVLIIKWKLKKTTELFIKFFINCIFRWLIFSNNKTRNNKIRKTKTINMTRFATFFACFFIHSTIAGFIIFFSAPGTHIFFFLPPGWKKLETRNWFWFWNVFFIWCFCDSIRSFLFLSKFETRIFSFFRFLASFSNDGKKNFDVGNYNVNIIVKHRTEIIDCVYDYKIRYIDFHINHFAENFPNMKRIINYILFFLWIVFNSCLMTFHLKIQLWKRYRNWKCFHKTENFQFFSIVKIFLTIVCRFFCFHNFILSFFVSNFSNMSSIHLSTARPDLYDSNCLIVPKTNFENKTFFKVNCILRDHFW